MSVCQEIHVRVKRHHEVPVRLQKKIEHTCFIRLEASDFFASAPQPPQNLAAPFNLVLTAGDTVIDAQVDAYPVVVDTYNWYLDGVPIDTTLNGSPSFQFIGLVNTQEYRVGVSVTVAGQESVILDWTNHIYDTAQGGNFDLAISTFNYHPQIHFYSGLHNRTYICWMGKDADLNPCYVFYYDHDTAEISASVLVGTADIGNNHNHASIIADSTGTLYVMFERAHNDPYKVFKSTNPEDISAWTQLSSIGTDVAYPSIFVDTADTIYVYGRGEHDRGVIFKSTDGGTTFSENIFANMDPAGDNRWFYHTIISSRKSQGMHIVVWLLNESLLTYPDAYYMHTMDGVTFGNIEYWESGGASGFSKDIIAEGAITKAEMDTNFSVALGADQSKYNTYQGGGLDINGNPYMLMMHGDEESVPQIESWRIAKRNAGAWEFTDISSLVSLSDVRGTSVTGIYRMQVIDQNTYRVWTYDFQGGTKREITQYITNDGGASWTLERYMTRNSSFENPPGAVAITHNHFDAPEPIFAWTYQNGADYSDVRTNIQVPALATPQPSPPNTNSLSYDGVNDFVEIPHAASIDIGGDETAYTVMGWFKFDTLSGIRIITAKLDLTTDNYPFYIFWADGSWRFILKSGGTGYTLVPAFSPSIEVWYHFAYVVDRVGNTTKVYFDGVLVDALDISAAVGTSAQNARPIKFGISQEGQFWHWDGFLDEMQLWNRALTEAEINEFGSKSLSGNESGLIGYWPTNTGSGTVAEDGTANNNDGTINGATWSTDTPF